MQCKSLWIKVSAKCINVNGHALGNITSYSPPLQRSPFTCSFRLFTVVSSSHTTTTVLEYLIEAFCVL